MAKTRSFSFDFFTHSDEESESYLSTYADLTRKKRTTYFYPPDLDFRLLKRKALSGMDLADRKGMHHSGLDQTLFGLPSSYLLLRLLPFGLPTD